MKQRGEGYGRYYSGDSRRKRGEISILMGNMWTEGGEAGIQVIIENSVRTFGPVKGRSKGRTSRKDFL